MVSSFFLSFGVIFVAELGDKSQLMAMAFAARYKALPVLIGISIATAVTHAMSVALGAVVGSRLPTDAIAIIAGIAFLIFAAWTLRGDALTEEEAEAAQRTLATQLSQQALRSSWPNLAIRQCWRQLLWRPKRTCLARGSVRRSAWCQQMLLRFWLDITWDHVCPRKLFVTAHQLFCDLRNFVDCARRVSLNEKWANRVSLRLLDVLASRDLRERL